MVSARVRPAALALLLAVGVVALGGCYNRSQRLYQRAEAFLARGESYLAAEQYRRLVLDAPRSPLADDALYKLAYLFREEFADPQKAIASYRMLADQYPDSPYADDSLLWVSYIQARDLGDAEAVRATLEAIRERFPDEPRIQARAHLNLVETLFSAHRHDAAMEEAQLLESSYPEQTRQAATAALIRARAGETRLADKGERKKLFEAVIAKYPDTYAATVAKSAVGLMYFDQKGEDEKRQQEELRAAARLITGIGPFTASGNSRRRCLGVLRALLAHHGVEIDEQTALALSGAAFDFFYKPEDPGVSGRLFIRNPHMLIAETLGLAANEWSAPSAESSFEALGQAIKHNRPVMLHHSQPESTWVIAVGIRPAHDEVTYIAPNGRGPTTCGRSTFMGRWGSESVLGLGPRYQFSISGRKHTPTAAELLEDTLRTAASAVAPRTVSGVPSGIDAYRALEQDLLAQPAGNRDKVVAWARNQLPELRRCRQAARAFLQQRAGALGGTRTQNLLEAARVYGDIDQELATLAGAIERAARGSETDAQPAGHEPPGAEAPVHDAERGGNPSENGVTEAEQWGRAARQLAFVMELEQQAGRLMQSAISN